jgi:hypothetical protein
MTSNTTLTPWYTRKNHSEVTARSFDHCSNIAKRDCNVNVNLFQRIRHNIHSSFNRSSFAILQGIEVGAWRYLQTYAMGKVIMLLIIVVIRGIYYIRGHVSQEIHTQN